MTINHQGYGGGIGYAEQSLRLSELIIALRSRHHLADALMARIEPDIMDELRAVAAHRVVDIEDLAADFLERLAAEAADAAWQVGVVRLSPFDPDPEAALLGIVLQSAARDQIQQNVRISAECSSFTTHCTFLRHGHPYGMA
ncbi:MAG: hypothetical protein ACKVON_05145 [Beijerinckiaceae bacterium]